MIKGSVKPGAEHTHHKAPAGLDDVTKRFHHTEGPRGGRGRTASLVDFEASVRQIAGTGETNVFLRHMTPKTANLKGYIKSAHSCLIRDVPKDEAESAKQLLNYVKTDGKEDGTYRLMTAERKLTAKELATVRELNEKDGSFKYTHFEPVKSEDGTKTVSFNEVETFGVVNKHGEKVTVVAMVPMKTVTTPGGPSIGYMQYGAGLDGHIGAIIKGQMANFKYVVAEVEPLSGEACATSGGVKMNGAFEGPMSVNGKFLFAPSGFAYGNEDGKPGEQLLNTLQCLPVVTKDKVTDIPASIAYRIIFGLYHESYYKADGMDKDYMVAILGNMASQLGAPGTKAETLLDPVKMDKVLAAKPAVQIADGTSSVHGIVYNDATTTQKASEENVNLAFAPATAQFVEYVLDPANAPKLVEKE